MALLTAPVSIFPVGQQCLKLLFSQRMQGSSCPFHLISLSVYGPLHRLVYTDLGTALSQYFGWDLTVQTSAQLNFPRIWPPWWCFLWCSWHLEQPKLDRINTGEMPQVGYKCRGRAWSRITTAQEMSGRVSASQHEWEISTAQASSAVLGCFFSWFTTSFSAPLVEPQLVSTQAWISLNQGMKPAGLGEIKILTRE